MLTSHIIRVAVEAALAEDAPYGDITCETTIPADETGSAHLTARENGVMSGIDVFAAAFAAQNPAVTVTAAIKDGERFQRGQILATVKGPVRDLLTAERIALNFTQRMSGIATMTAAFVDAVNAIYGDDYDGPVTRPRRYERTRIVDTRKTTPGLRPFEKYAVVCGGGHNHRYGLSDAVMMKDNHLAALAARGIRPEVKNTICFATRQRQESAAALAGEVDAIVVIGGRNSSNTTRLADICAAVCPRTHHVEAPGELDPAWFAGCESVGVTAGASTPEDQIAAIVERLEAL